MFNGTCTYFNVNSSIMVFFILLCQCTNCLAPSCRIWAVRTRWGSWGELCPTPTSSLTRCATGTPSSRSSGRLHTHTHWQTGLLPLLHGRVLRAKINCGAPADPLSPDLLSVSSLHSVASLLKFTCAVWCNPSRLATSTKTEYWTLLKVEFMAVLLY